MNTSWHFLKLSAMMVPADQMANPLQHTRLSEAELLMREAIQNSADEKRPDVDSPVRFSVRRKLYQGEEKANLIRKLRLEDIKNRTMDFPQSHGWFKYEETCLKSLNDLDIAIPVLLLSDHNTNGLGGNWRRGDDVGSRFFNLVLSMYASRKQDTFSDLLGSYGVGKMVYAVTSSIRTMAYYSSFTPDRSTEGASARFMATAFLPKHRKEEMDYSGHAFFGIGSNQLDYPAAPLTDIHAHEFAESIGLDVRSENDTGLTVMLLDCNLSPDDCLKACEKFWWPRMIDEHSREFVKMEFIDGDERLPSPEPSKRPELKPFIYCHSNIKQRVDPEGYENKPITLRDSGEVGRLCMSALQESDIEGNSLANTVALIRSGLVIQYKSEYAREDDPHAIGVFEAIGTYASECYTFSEPEAHDEWNPYNSRLERHLGDKGVNLVRLTHKRIKENFRDFQMRQKEVKRKPSSEGLTFLDNALGSLFQSRKKGNPPVPKPSHRAFTIRKRGWRDVNNLPIRDNFEFRIALAEGVSEEPVTCEVKTELKILEEVNAKPGTSVPCSVVDNSGAKICNGLGKFNVKLFPNAPLKFHAYADVNPKWRTCWIVTVERRGSDAG